MTALPDILAGLFIYATLILIFGLAFPGWRRHARSAVTVLPIVCRAATSCSGWCRAGSPRRPTRSAPGSGARCGT